MSEAYAEPRKLKEQPQDPFNVTELSMVVHAGTHVDSPRHYFLDGPAFEEIPLDRLYGAGVALHLPKKPDEVIQVAELERARPLLLPGDILAIDTGWSTRFGTVSPIFIASPREIQSARAAA
jgi:kynurenine formamidase